MVRITENDTSEKSLGDAIAAGIAIDLNVLNPGGNETLVINVDTTEIGTTTWGSGSGITWTFDASAGIDPTFVFASNSVVINSAQLGVGITPVAKVTVDGTLVLKEVAVGLSPGASYGEIFVVSDTPNTLWFTNDAGGVTQLGNGGLIRAVSTKTGNYTLTANDCTVFLSQNAPGVYVLTFPAAGSHAGRHYWISNIGLQDWGLSTVSGAASIASGVYYHVVSDGTNWYVIGR